jgi:hypothetical protein
LQPVTNILQHENGYLFAESYSVLSRRRNHFFHLLNVNGVHNVRQTEIHTAGPLVPEPSAFEFESNVVKLKRNKSPGTYWIPTKFIKARGRNIRNEIHKRINSIWKKEELPEKWNKSIIIPVYKKDNKTDFSI